MPPTMVRHSGMSMARSWRAINISSGRRIRAAAPISARRPSIAAARARSSDGLATAIAVVVSPSAWPTCVRSRGGSGNGRSVSSWTSARSRARSRGGPDGDRELVLQHRQLDVGLQRVLLPDRAGGVLLKRHAADLVEQPGQLAVHLDGARGEVELEVQLARHANHLEAHRAVVLPHRARHRAVRLPREGSPAEERHHLGDLDRPAGIDHLLSQAAGAIIPSTRGRPRRPRPRPSTPWMPRPSASPPATGCGGARPLEDAQVEFRRGEQTLVGTVRRLRPIGADRSAGRASPSKRRPEPPGTWRMQRTTARDVACDHHLHHRGGPARPRAGERNGRSAEGRQRPASVSPEGVIRSDQEDGGPEQRWRGAGSFGEERMRAARARSRRARRGRRRRSPGRAARPSGRARRARARVGRRKTIRRSRSGRTRSPPTPWKAPERSWGTSPWPFGAAHAAREGTTGVDPARSASATMEPMRRRWFMVLLAEPRGPFGADPRRKRCRFEPSGATILWYRPRFAGLTRTHPGSFQLGEPSVGELPPVWHPGQ